LNIVSNAFDAVEDRPDPRVGVKTELEADGAWVRILVVDNGGGIAPEKIKDIFKPFVSTKGSKGTGLGLPVSRKILREHGGDILVESLPGKGSRFVLRLPLKSPLSQEMNSGATAELPVAPPEPE
ncbi:MAG TPA: HAMP domain-containing sensor histidine kinase, partial [Gemmataceae bacterium]|nr:HAMP domain-containing sensor histidine kinase [Gemmataceae bacterium]